MNWQMMCASLMTVSALTLVGCAGVQPTNMGLHQGQFTPCPSSPNCVSSYSESADDGHAFPAYRLVEGNDDIWNQLTQAVASLPRTSLVSHEKPYLYAQSHSRLFGFVDDVQLYLDAETQTFYFYSASRVGYSDLGVNRSRLEQLVEILKQSMALEVVTEN